MTNYCTLCHKKLEEKQETIRFIDNTRFVLCEECANRQLKAKLINPFDKIIVLR